jgi:hypothetical protein
MVVMEAFERAEERLLAYCGSWRSAAFWTSGGDRPVSSWPETAHPLSWCRAAGCRQRDGDR